MLIIKTIISVFILFTTLSIGNLISKKYKNRVEELKEFKNALNMFKAKIKFTYEPIPDIFNQIGDTLKTNVKEIFKISSEKMQTEIAGKAWDISLDVIQSNINEEDKQILKSLSKLLGQTDLEGQLSEIELTSNFLDLQIQKAEKEKEKNEKLYKTLGAVAGVGIVIILI